MKKKMVPSFCMLLFCSFFCLSTLFTEELSDEDRASGPGLLNITTVDSSAYAVNDRVAFYFYLLDSEGNPVKNLDEEKLSVFEQDLFFDRTNQVEDFEVAPTDRMVKPANFLFLLDNSLSMYWSVLPGSFEADYFEKTILDSITLGDQKRYVARCYYKQDSSYLLKKNLDVAVKNRAGYIINHYNENLIKTRMEVLKEVLNIFISSMPDSFDNKMVVSFNKDISALTEFTISNETLISSLDDIVKPDEVNGWTELYEALNESVNLLAEKGGRKFLILLSDGYQASDDPYEKSSVLEDALVLAREHNIIVFTIGFGSDTDKKLLKELAGATGGVCLEAGDKTYLSRAYQKISAILESEFKLICRNSNFFSEKRSVRVEYDTLSSEKNYTLGSIMGAGVSPYNWFLLLLILLSIALVAGIRIFMHREPGSASFINLDTDTRIVLNTKTLGIGGKKGAPASTRVVLKEGTCIIEGKKTSVNNNAVTGTRILKPGDVIIADDGTKMLFTGKIEGTKVIKK